MPCPRGTMDPWVYPVFLENQTDAVDVSTASTEATKTFMVAL